MTFRSFMLAAGIIAVIFAIAAPDAAAAPDGKKAAVTDAPGSGEDAKGNLTPADRAVEEIGNNFALRNQRSRELAQHFFMVGKAHYDKFDYVEAKKNFKRAYELWPQLKDSDGNDASIYLRRAQWMLGERDPEIALNVETLYQMRRVAIQQQQTELERTVNAAKRLLETENYERAIEQFELALEIIRWFPYRIDTNNYEAYSKKSILEAQSKLRWKKINDSREKLQQALDDASKAEFDRVQRGLRKLSNVYDQIHEALRLEKYDRAIKSCEEILDQDPNSKEAQRLLEVAVEGKQTKFTHKTFVDYYEHMIQNMEQWNETWVPYQEYVVWPEKERWLEIAARPEGVVDDIEQDPEEVEQIKKILNTRKVTLTFDGATLAQVISFLQDITNLNITIDPTLDIADKQISLNLKEILLKNALNIICDQIGMVYVFKDNVVFITEKGKEHGKGIFEIYNVSDVLQKINDFPGPNLRVFDPENPQSAGTGLAFQDSQEETEAWIDSEKIIELIKEGTGGDEAWPSEDDGYGLIEYHSGQLVVINSREVHRQIRKILLNIRKNSGIFICMEARFVELFDDFLRDVGVDLRGLGADYGTPFAPPPDAGWVANPDPNNTLAGRTQNVLDGYPVFMSGERLNEQTAGGFARITMLDPYQVSALIHMKDEYAKRRILSSAAVTATNGERVFVSVVNQRAYIADYELGGAMSVGIAAEIGDPVVRNFQEGIVLDVRPTVSSDRKYITIDARPTVARLVGDTLSTVVVNLGTTTQAVTNGIIELPNIQLQQALTTVTIPDGGTILLGGLQIRQWREYTSTTPLFGSIPFLKLLFTRTGTIDEREHLVILLTGKIILLRDLEHEKFGTGDDSQ